MQHHGTGWLGGLGEGWGQVQLELRIGCNCQIDPVTEVLVPEAARGNCVTVIDGRALLLQREQTARGQVNAQNNTN